MSTILTIDDEMRPSTAALSELLQAENWDRLRECMRGAMRDLGARDFMLKIEISSISGSRSGHVFGTLPQAMLTYFNNILDVKSDPVTSRFADSDLPIVWDIEKFCVSTANHLYLLLRTKGICRGLSLMLRTQNAVSRIDFYGNKPDSFSCAGARLADALLVGLYLHQASEGLWRKCTPEPPALLSGREIECLMWSAAGKTSQEIGAILGISHRTVYFHLKNVAAKLDVYSTRHAVSRAISMGIIKPVR